MVQQCTHSGSAGCREGASGSALGSGGESLEGARRHQNDPGLQSPATCGPDSAGAGRSAGNGGRAARRIMANAPAATVTAMAAADQDPNAPA
jgi:hypothetical protein